MIKAVIFDLDNTLYNYDLCNRYGFEKLKEYMSAYGIAEDGFERAYLKARDEVKKQLSYDYAARHNRVLYCQRCAELLGLNSFELALDMYNAYWNSFLEKAELFDDAAGLLDMLRDKGVKTAICTDMTAHIQFRKISKLLLSERMDCMVSSEEAGAEKPSPVIFSLTAQKLGVENDECVYIGDDFKRDIIGAKNAGMTALYFSGEKRRDVLCFENYKEIRGYFEALGF